MTLTGLGGSGSNTNAGVYIDTSGLAVNFGSNTNNQLNFLNCIGGFVGSNNYGVYVGGTIATTTGTGLNAVLECHRRRQWSGNTIITGSISRTM